MRQVAVKEERRVLRYASDGLNGKMGCLRPAQRRAVTRFGKPRNDLVARQLTVNTMRLGCVLTQALDTVGLIGLKVALEPIPVARILVGAFPRQNVRGDAVQEHTIVANDHRAARELEQRRLERGQCLDVEVVRGLVEEQQVAALLERERQVQTVALATGERFCWSWPLKPKLAT